MAAAPERYDLIERLAAGGMGEIYLGRVRGEHGFHKTVAVKRILPELARNPEFVVRFVAEAKLAVSLSHANVVQVFDLGRAGDDLLLVMEYVRGADLGRLQAALTHRGERPPVNVVVHLAMEALKGLDYAHAAGVVHCDVSPANLLVSYAGEVKITDFGIAQALDGAGRRRAGGSVMGKLRYLAPEQIARGPLDARTDLYALAVVLHEVLTLGRLFDAPDPEATAALVMAGKVPRLMRLRPEVPEDLDALLHRALSRNVKERPSSARELLGELLQIARGLEPVSAPDVGAWVRGLLPPVEPTAKVGFDAALAQLGVGVARPTGTLSAVAPELDEPKATASFVVRRTEDGVTVLEPLKQRRRRREWTAMMVGSALMLGMISMGVVLVKRSRSEAHPPVAAAPPIASAPAPAPVPAPMPAPAIVPAPAPAPPVEKPRPRPAAKPKTAFLNIYAEPWAQVALDGKAAGTTPIMKLAVAPGIHRVRLTHPGAQPSETTVRVTAGETRLVDVDLGPRRP